MRRWLLAALLGAPACDPAERSDRGGVPPLPAVAPPEDLVRVLRDYERASAARDTSALAAIFTSDGFVLASGALTRTVLMRVTSFGFLSAALRMVPGTPSNAPAGRMSPRHHRG